MATIARQESTSTETPRDDEWTVEALDIDAYLSRIGYEGSLDPTVETLFALHRAHANSIPFENLDIPLGRGITLELNDIQDKLVRHRRGGYCYEHNSLFAALLERIGFEVHRYVARVQPDKPGPRSHMLLNVEAGGQTWHADVGFGAALLEPLLTEHGRADRQGDWTHGLARSEDGRWTLRSLGPDGWSDLYEYIREPQRHIDYVINNHFTATHPRSPFVGQIVAIRLTPDMRYTLRGRELSIQRPDGTVDSREVDAEDLGSTLRETFGIELGSSEGAHLEFTMTG